MLFSEQINSVLKNSTEMCGRDFAAYLQSLDRDTLCKVQAFMYSGRDSISYETYRNSPGMNERETRWIVQSISEKSGCLPKYFRNAEEKIKKEGMDINSLQ